MAQSNEIISAHLQHMRVRGLSETYIYSRSRALARLQAALPGPLLSVTRAHLLAWQKLCLAGLCTDAQIVALTHAREFYAWALHEKYISVSPAATLPMPRRQRRLPRPIPDDKLLSVVPAAPRKVRLSLVLAGWCGLRAQEIAYLTRECVLEHVPALLVDVRAAKGSRERTVPLSAYVLGELAHYGMPRRGWIIRRTDGQPGPNRPWRISQICNDYLHDCGLDDTLHSLRHRFGTQTLAAEHDIRAVQEMLGHAHVTSTQIYTAFSADSQLRAVQSLRCPASHLTTQ